MHRCDSQNFIIPGHFYSSLQKLPLAWKLARGIGISLREGKKKEEEENLYVLVRAFSYFPAFSTYISILLSEFRRRKTKRRKNSQSLLRNNKKGRANEREREKKKGAKRLKPSSRLIARTPPNAQVSFIASRFTFLTRRRVRARRRLNRGHNRDSIGPRA